MTVYTVTDIQLCLLLLDAAKDMEGKAQDWISPPSVCSNIPSPLELLAEDMSAASTSEVEEEEYWWTGRDQGTRAGTARDLEEEWEGTVVPLKPLAVLDLASSYWR